jgi:hypothetical protein
VDNTHADPGKEVRVGDSTNHDDVVRLMAGDVADLVFTDPPYNVDYEGYTEQKLKIKGDRMSDAKVKQFLEVAFRMRWRRRVLQFGVRLFGRKTRSLEASAATNSGTSHSSTVASLVRRTRGTGTKPNRYCGK